MFKHIQFPTLILVTPESAKRPLFLSFCVTLCIIIASGGYYLFAQPVVPMFYTLPRPAQSLATKEWLFLFPSLSFFFSLLHVLIVHWLRNLEPLVLQLFSRAGLALQIVLLAVVIRIILITL